MMRTSVAWFLTSLLAGCLSESDPRGYPLTIRIEEEHSQRVVARDIDGDGRDELVHLVRNRNAPGQLAPGSYSLFVDEGGNTLDQMNYSGFAQDPHVLDLTGDGRPEVLVPVVRNDSLFASIASPEGKTIDGFHLMSGQPRSEPDGDLPWDPSLLDAWVVDIDGDGQGELLSLVSTGYARQPRGLLVHDLSNGNELGRAIIGGFPRSWLLTDFDLDGMPEVLVATQPTNHGAVAGGLADSLSYLALLEIAPTPRVAWARELPSQTISELGRSERADEPTGIVLARAGPSLELHRLRPDGRSVAQRRDFTDPYLDVLLVDLDLDLDPEIVALQPLERRMVAFGPDFGEIADVSVPFTLGYGQTWPDADNDGVDEIVFAAPTGFAMFAPDLTVKAVFPWGEIISVERREQGQEPRLLIWDGDRTALATLQTNPFYLVFRVGPSAAVSLILSLLLVGGARAQRARSRNRADAEAIRGSLQLDSRVLAVVDARGRVVWCDDALRKRGDGKTPNLDVICDSSPALGELFGRAMVSDPPASANAEISDFHSSGGISRRVTVLPLVLRHHPGSPVYWQAIVASESGVGTDSWPMMAQRIAHALKNPLTHMLLTVQRLQAEYRERAPAVAGRLDPYADRIQDGIGQLRRLTSSFLKLVDLEDPDLERTDLNAVVREFVNTMKAKIPPDIALRSDLDPNISEAMIDREQMVVALENLVINAINAMDSGGMITLSTSATNGAPIGRLGATRYIEVEVIDTGAGIPPEHRERIFESGFSLSEEGSGLGLAIVEKIVNDHGGLLSLESEVGIGSVFTIRLPAREPESVSGPRTTGELR